MLTTPTTLGHFTVSRHLAAARAEVWQAWTEAGRLARWWGPVGFAVPRGGIELDLRPGGTLRATVYSQDDLEERFYELEFRELAPPARLVLGWEELDDLGPGELTAMLVARRDTTMLKLTLAVAAAENVVERARLDWQDRLERLAAALAGV